MGREEEGVEEGEEKRYRYEVTEWTDIHRVYLQN